ncbi:glucuronate isomerase, partial [Holdemania massiliensis]
MQIPYASIYKMRYTGRKSGVRQMKKFMDEDFLLQNETAKRLYHEAAQKMPILDYHNHL